MFFQSSTSLTDLSLLLMRLMVGAVFLTSGWNDLRDPGARGKSLGISKAFTIFLGTAEVMGSLGIMAGALTKWAALGLILIGLGAIQKKIFVWHSGFWGEKNLWLALRPDASVNEPGDSVHSWRELGAFEIGKTIIS